MKLGSALRRKIIFHKMKSFVLQATPIILFLFLLFSEPVALFGWSADGISDPEVDKDKYPHKQFNYINIEIDTTLGYAPSLFKAGLIYDFTENRLVWEKNLEEVFPIASLTKMMVALIAIEQIDAGNIKLDDIATISKMQLGLADLKFT